MERMYRIDQDVLDARGIGLSVAEVVGLSTAEYAARLRRLNLSAVDTAFVKSLRRRIKNRMASQNSRRRTAEHIRSLTDELHAVRASKDDILAERRELTEARARVAAALRRLRDHLAEKLKERGDDTELPFAVKSSSPNHVFQTSRISTQPKHNLTLSQTYVKDETDLISEKEKSLFECRLESLVQRSVNHMYRFERHKAGGPEPCEVLRSGNGASEVAADEGEQNDLVSDMVKLKNFAAEVCKPKNLIIQTVDSISKSTNVNGGEDGKDAVTDAYKTGHVAEKRRNKYLDETTIQLISETYRKKNTIDEFKLQPNETIAPDAPRIVRAKCVTIARNDGKEELNARKPRKRNKEAALREAKRATFKEIMESTYKEINGVSLIVNEDTEAAAVCDEIKEVLLNETNKVISRDSNDALWRDTNKAALRDNSKAIMFGEINAIKEQMKEMKKAALRKTKEAAINETSDAAKTNGCIVHTSDAQYDGAAEAAGAGHGEALNLSLKEGRGQRRHHGRKQAAPRRITHAPSDASDMVLDLKIKTSTA